MNAFFSTFWIFHQMPFKFIFRNSKQEREYSDIWNPYSFLCCVGFGLFFGMGLILAFYQLFSLCRHHLLLLQKSWMVMSKLLTNSTKIKVVSSIWTLSWLSTIQWPIHQVFSPWDWDGWRFHPKGKVNLHRFIPNLKMNGSKSWNAMHSFLAFDMLRRPSLVGRPFWLAFKAGCNHLTKETRWRRWSSQCYQL